MKLIEEEILRKGHVINNDIIKVDSFLNHQIDTKLLKEFAKEVKRQFGDTRVDKILTIETSGIPVAYAISEEYGYIPFVFAKKTKSAIVDDNVYKGIAKSFTRKTISEITVSKDYLLKDENILIVDDFLAEGNAALALINMCKEAGANVVGYVSVIEKIFQGGRKRLEEAGYKVFVGASIKAFKDNKPIF